MNLLIMDDEPLILKNVQAQLESMDLPVDRIDTAGSASEARRKTADTVYDIFLCDIVMPEEDGISFAKWALQCFPDAKFIFLTAHADFEYMKEAISIQSFDYVLQPVSAEELKSVIERAIHQISIEEKNRRLMEKGSFFENHEIQILEGNSIRYLMGLSKDPSFLKELLEDNIGTVYEDDAYLIYYVQMLSASPIRRTEDLSIFRSVYYNVTNETFGAIGLKNALLIRNDLSGNFIGILKFREEEYPDSEELVDSLEELCGFFEKPLSLKVAVYAGRICYFEDLPSMLHEVMEEIPNNVHHVSRVFRAGELTALPSQGHSFDQESAAWKALLQKNRLKDLKDSIFRYLDYHSARGAVNREFLMKLHQRSSELILAYMANEDIASADVFDEKLSYYDFMYCFDSVEHLKDGLSYVFEKLYTNVDIPGEETIQKVIRYVRNNLDREILVTEIAEYISLNPVYLTRLFKKSQGMSLKRFIESEKMEATKHLLSTTSLPISVISGHVGYANYSNFTRSFKLFTGLTPSEYREKERKTE